MLRTRLDMVNTPLHGDSNTNSSEVYNGMHYLDPFISCKKGFSKLHKGSQSHCILQT